MCGVYGVIWCFGTRHSSSWPHRRTPRRPTTANWGGVAEKKSQLFKGGFSCFLTQKREENEGDFYYTHIHLYIYEYNIFKTTFQQPAKFLLQITTNSR